mgnify:CR=1 FL=1
MRSVQADPDEPAYQVAHRGAGGSSPISKRYLSAHSLAQPKATAQGTKAA